MIFQKKTVLYIIFFIYLVSCKKESNQRTEIEKTNEIVTLKKEKNIDVIINNLSKNDTIEFLDLVDFQLDELPDLSEFFIKKLDVSYNNLDSIPVEYLPRKLESLKCTNNRLRVFKLHNGTSSSNNTELNLHEINFSNNKLESFNYAVRDKKNIYDFCHLKRINLSNNNLKYVSIDCNRVSFLNISNNPRLSNVFNFNINSIDTILRKNIGNDLPLEKIKYKKSIPIE
jgi:hypothetical protein